MWQLKHLRRRYWVSFDAASSVCCTGRPVCGDRYDMVMGWHIFEEVEEDECER